MNLFRTEIDFAKLFYDFNTFMIIITLNQFFFEFHVI